MHIDGRRVDAVASMLYVDYSREEGEWVPNQYDGRENFAAIDFLRQLNVAIREQCPSALMIAEGPTSWPQVSRPVDVGGLGFDIKWNMGWMYDTLCHMANEPIHRQYHQGMLYCSTENFMLPFSYDEVVLTGHVGPVVSRRCLHAIRRQKNRILSKSRRLSSLAPVNDLLL